MHKIQAKRERVEARLLARTRVDANGAVSTLAAGGRRRDQLLASRLESKYNAVSAWLQKALMRGREENADDARKCTALHVQRLQALTEKQRAEEKRDAINNVVKPEANGPTGGGVLALLEHLRKGGHRAAHKRVARACKSTLAGGGGADWMQILHDNKDTVLKAAAAAGAVGTAYLFKDEISSAVKEVWTQTMSLIQSLAAKLEELVKNITQYELKFMGLKVPGLGVVAALMAAWHTGALQSMCRRETDDQFETRAWDTMTSWGGTGGVLGAVAGAGLALSTGGLLVPAAVIGKTAALGSVAAAGLGGTAGYHTVKDAPLVGGRDYGWLCNMPLNWYNFSFGLGPAIFLVPMLLSFGTTGAKTYATTGNAATAVVAAADASVRTGTSTFRRVAENVGGVARAGWDQLQCTQITNRSECTEHHGCAWNGQRCQSDGNTLPGVDATVRGAEQLGKSVVQAVEDGAYAVTHLNTPRHDARPRVVPRQRTRVRQR